MLSDFVKVFKPKKIRVAVIMGGPSAEHEVSLASGKMVIKNLNPSKYEVAAIKIERDGRWPITLKELTKNFDVAFLATHGEYGEDGRLQALLEKYHIPYTGSDSKTSRLAMDKGKVSRLLANKKIAVPAAINFKKGGNGLNFKKMADWGWPIVIKPTDRGSSLGVSIVKTIGKLAPAINNALAFSNNLMAEQFVAGRELTCGVIEKNGKLMALPPTEIITKAGNFFDFQAKYQPGGSKEITPPPNMSALEIKKIQDIAMKVFKTVGCRGYGRVDMIMDQSGQLNVLEINTLPGLTKTSLLPQAALAAGISFSELLDLIVKNARR